MTPGRIDEILRRIRSIRVAVIGDFCLDAYWRLDTGTPEISLETGKPTRAVRSQRSSPGGAGNVAANLVALGAGTVRAFGVTGPDMFGRELVLQLQERGVETSGMLIQSRGWDTPVYAKPYAGGTEQERIDFGRWNAPAPGTETALSAALRSALPSLDAVVVNQQLDSGIMSVTMIQSLNAIARERPGALFVLDSRTMSGAFTGMVCKMNAAEASRLARPSGRAGGILPPAAFRSSVRAIAERTGKAVFVTRGAGGILVFDGSRFFDLPAIPVPGPVDSVGAGDTAFSAIAASLAAGASFEEAGAMGNLAAAVSVRKVGETGTATEEEIRAVASQ